MGISRIILNIIIKVIRSSYILILDNRKWKVAIEGCLISIIVKFVKIGDFVLQ